jgi:transcriptional regulator with XRE-family HTH domain
MQNVSVNRNKLKRARELRGWSQANVAENLGCDARSVGRWERGAVSPSTYYRQKLCLLFEQNMEELGFLEEPIKDAQVVESLEHEPFQAQSEQNIEEHGRIDAARSVSLEQEPSHEWSKQEMKIVQVSSYIESYPSSQKRGDKVPPVSIFHNTPTRIFIELFFLLVLVMGSIITFISFHSVHIPVNNIVTNTPITNIRTNTPIANTPVTDIPYGKLLYITTTPGHKCDLGGGQWVDYNQPDIQCSATNSIISNSSSTSPDLRGTILTHLPNDTYPDNYVLEAQIQQPSTSTDFGLYFRNQAGDQQGIYTFFIHPNGSWGVYVYDNITAAQNQIASGITSINPHSQLYLTVVAIGPDFTFYINRQKVSNVHDATYGTGTVGIAVDAGGTIVVSKVGLYRVA